MAGAFGVDALRYFLLREVSFGQDGSYSAEAIVTRVNAELANSFGNLAQRSLSMVFKNLDGVLPAAGRSSWRTSPCSPRSSRAASALADRIRPLRLLGGDRGVDGRGVRLQAYVDAQAPWALKKTDPERMAAVLGTIVAAVRQLADGDRAGRPGLGGQRCSTLIASGAGRRADRAAGAGLPAARARGGDAHEPDR